MQAQGEFARVENELGAVLDLPGQPVKRGTMAHQHIIHMMLADSAAMARDMAGLRRNAPRLEELARRDDHRPYLAVAHRAFGVAHSLAGEQVEAVSRLNQAMAIFVDLEMGWQVGRTYFEMGEVARHLADVERARSYYDQALAAFEVMKAKPDIERTRRAMATLN
jgi:tetratricopeptide (TPR) repeat protein